MDKGDGVVIQLVHNAKQPNFNVDCKVKGALPIKELTSFYDPTSSNNFIFVAARWFLFLATTFLGFYFLVSTIYKSRANPIMWAVGAFITIFCFVGSWVLFKFCTAKVPPRQMGEHLNRSF